MELGSDICYTVSPLSFRSPCLTVQLDQSRKGIPVGKTHYESSRKCLENAAGRPGRSIAHRVFRQLDREHHTILGFCDRLLHGQAGDQSKCAGLAKLYATSNGALCSNYRPRE